MLREVPSPRLRTVDRELRRTLLTVGDELRRARVNAGLSQVSVARALNRSASTVSRVESGRARQLTMETLLRQAAVVGLVARVALYPAGRAVRDARQLGLEQRFRSAISAAWACGAEVPLPILGDLRAVDLVISRPGCRIAVEVITRLGDVQAQLRAALLKQRDGGIRSTHHHRRRNAREPASPRAREGRDRWFLPDLVPRSACRSPGRSRSRRERCDRHVMDLAPRGGIWPPTSSRGDFVGRFVRQVEANCQRTVPEVLPKRSVGCLPPTGASAVAG